MSNTERNRDNICKAGMRRFPKRNSWNSNLKTDYLTELEDAGLHPSVAKRFNRDSVSPPNSYDDIVVSSLREGRKRKH